MFDELKPQKYELRDYQKEAVEAGLNSMNGDQGPGVIVLPTGSGKSLVIAKIVEALPGKTLVFQPSKEILEQNYEKYITYADSPDVGIYSASVGQKQIARVVFAMIGSVINKKSLFDEFDNIIIDECHLVNPKYGMYKTFLQNIENKKVLGLTATPYRLSTSSFGATLKFITRTRERVFTHVSYFTQVKTLSDMGFMAKMKYYKIEGFDSSKLKNNSTGAEFSEQSIKRYYAEIDFDNSLKDVVKRLVNAGRKNILVFTQFTHEAEKLVKELGSIAQVVTAETKKKAREQILYQFKSGEIKVIANVGVLTTGFDFPELETVVLARPTKSLALYYQMVGRGIRPHKGKEHCRVVDMCENVERFGRVEELWLDNHGKGKRYIKTGERQLTNIIL